MMNQPKKIIVHHSADIEPASQLDKINEWHKHLDFPISQLGYYVGYHYLIAHDGTVTQTRKLSEEGAHTRGQNFCSVGVCLEGNFDVEEPTDVQVDALGKLLAQLCKQFGLGATDIFPHRHFTNKDCYGTNLSDEWAQIICLQSEVKTLDDTLICSEN